MQILNFLNGLLQLEPTMTSAQAGKYIKELKDKR